MTMGMEAQAAEVRDLAVQDGQGGLDSGADTRRLRGRRRLGKRPPPGSFSSLERPVGFEKVSVYFVYKVVLVVTFFLF